jgi:hypothetical protein
MAAEDGDDGVCYGACEDFRIGSVSALRTAVSNLMHPTDGVTAGNTLRLTQSLQLDQCVARRCPAKLQSEPQAVPQLADTRRSLHHCKGRAAR